MSCISVRYPISDLLSENKYDYLQIGKNQAFETGFFSRYLHVFLSISWWCSVLCPDIQIGVHGSSILNVRVVITDKMQNGTGRPLVHQPNPFAGYLLSLRIS